MPNLKTVLTIPTIQAMLLAQTCRDDKEITSHIPGTTINDIVNKAKVKLREEQEARQVQAVANLLEVFEEEKLHFLEMVRAYKVSYKKQLAALKRLEAAVDYGMSTGNFFPAILITCPAFVETFKEQGVPKNLLIMPKGPGSDDDDND